ncbi:MAG: hypothetical protein DSY47_02380 [Hydrogenothermus sp.]|nr:MAG: hypothetical protein DSY47_02380 [Hydrogenothermus sp.]
MSQSDTKKRLINSAVKLFSKNGYFNTKVSDIVKDAGVAQGTFYLYFKSKEEIFIYIVEEIVRKIKQQTEKFSKGDWPADEKLKNFASSVFHLLSEYKEVAKIYFFYLLCTDEKFQKIHFEAEQMFKSFYLDVLKSYEDKELLTDILLGFGKRLFEINFLRDQKPIEEVIKEFEEGLKLILRKEK